MIEKNIEDSLSSAELKAGINFTTQDFAEVQVKTSQDRSSYVNITIDGEWLWGRKSIKELIQLLEVVRMHIPKDKK